MKMRKLLGICLLLTASLLLKIFALPTQVQAAKSNHYICAVSNGEVTITGWDYLTGTHISIPSTIDGYPVTGIGNSAFANFSYGQTVFVPDSVKCIGDDAFINSTGLTSVTIGNGVTSIGNSAFYNCTSLTRITIPNSVECIGNSAFGWCTSLAGIWVDENNTAYSSDSYGVLFNKEKTILIQAPGGISGSYTIPDSVISIGESAFEGCTSLTSVMIPDSVKCIGNEAFVGCDSLISVTIPDSVNNIGDDAFWLCNSLNSVTIGDGVERIGVRAFYNCTSLNDITIPDSVISVGGSAFSGCDSLLGVTIGNGVTSIGEGAFADCGSLASICVDENNTAYSSDSYGVLFNKEKTTLLQAPGGISGNYTVPDGVVSIGDIAFFKCTGLVRITIPRSVESLGMAAFGWCTSLTSVSIPDSVTSIGSAAFNCCDCLIDAYYGGTESQWNSISIGSYNEKLTAVTIHYNHPAHDFTVNSVACSLCDYVRASISINKVVLRPSCSGLYFKGTFDFGAYETVNRYGIAVSVYNELPVADDSDATSLYTIGNNSVLISNILGEGKTGREMIYARPYVLLEGGTYIYGDVLVANLNAVVETIDVQLDSLDAVQKEALITMYQQNRAVMQDWLIPNIKEYGL